MHARRNCALFIHGAAAYSLMSRHSIVLAEILGRGRNSILYQKLVKTQIAQSANSFNSTTELSGEFIISISPFPGKSLAEMEKLVNEALADFEQRGVG